MIKVLLIVPSLIKSGMVNVAVDIAEGISTSSGFAIDICYLDERTSERKFIGNFKIFHFSIFKVLCLKKYDIVHSHGLRPDSLNLLLKILFNKKHISTIHNYIYDDVFNTHGKFLAKILGIIWPLILRNLSSVVVLSSHAKEYYEDRGIKNLDIIYNGRSINSIFISQEDLSLLSNLKVQYKLIGIHCEVTKRKGISQVINSLASDKLSNCALVVIGGGIEISQLKIQAFNLNILNRVFFIGYRDNPYGIVEQLDCYVMPSYSEGFGLSLIEAALLERTIVCSNIPIFRELFNEDEVLFFELNNIDSLIQAITIALGDAKSFAIKSHGKALQSFTMRSMIDTYLDLYLKIL